MVMIVTMKQCIIVMMMMMIVKQTKLTISVPMRQILANDDYNSCGYENILRKNRTLNIVTDRNYDTCLYKANIRILIEKLL